MDHPVLVPTSEGPVGGVVSEPAGEQRAALVLLGGYGRPARSGINAFWTRTARALADLGVLTLRFDYAREGETLPVGEGVSGQTRRRDFDLGLLRQVVPWFRRRAGEPALLLAGSCAGARLSIEFAGAEPDAVAGLFLIVPHIRTLLDPNDEENPEPPGSESVDPMIVTRIQATLERAPVWILTGEHDREDVPRLVRMLGPDGARLEREVAPGVALHLLDQAPLQELAADRLLARVARTPAESRQPA